MIKKNKQPLLEYETPLLSEIASVMVYGVSCADYEATTEPICEDEISDIEF